ncbi:hypothetical protein ACVCNH_18060 [Achromobacter anxifer]
MVDFKKMQEVNGFRTRAIPCFRNFNAFATGNFRRNDAAADCYAHGLRQINISTIRTAERHWHAAP